MYMYMYMHMHMYTVYMCTCTGKTSQLTVHACIYMYMYIHGKMCIAHLAYETIKGCGERRNSYR